MPARRVPKTLRRGAHNVPQLLFRKMALRRALLLLTGYRTSLAALRSSSAKAMTAVAGRGAANSTRTQVAQSNIYSVIPRMMLSK